MRAGVEGVGFSFDTRWVRDTRWASGESVGWANFAPCTLALSAPSTAASREKKKTQNESKKPQR